MAQAGKISNSRRGRKPASEKRPFRLRRYLYLFLIVCEDQSTEPYYFNTFLQDIPEKTIHLSPVGTGRDPLGVVQQAQVERDDLAEECGRDVDEVWVVFDKDDADRDPAKTLRFNSAEVLIQQEGFKVAFSNEVFELWLLLHLVDVDVSVPIHRNDIYTMLGEALRQHPEFASFQYNHRTSAASSVVQAVLKVGSEEQAILRATQLLVAHDNKPALQTNPSTRVHKLVMNLREKIAFYTD